MASLTEVCGCGSSFPIQVPPRLRLVLRLVSSVNFGFLTRTLLLTLSPRAKPQRRPKKKSRSRRACPWHPNTVAGGGGSGWLTCGGGRQGLRFAWRHPLPCMPSAASSPCLVCMACSTVSAFRWPPSRPLFGRCWVATGSRTLGEGEREGVGGGSNNGGGRRRARSRLIPRRLVALSLRCLGRTLEVPRRHSQC